MKILKKIGINKHHQMSSPILLRHELTSSDAKDERHNMMAVAVAASMKNVPPTFTTSINGFLPG